MCGICGYWNQASLWSPEEALDVAVKMSRRLQHRGPDAEGAWVDEIVAVGLGHRRLAVLDLTPQGAQPMESGSGRYVITYNGEIYNFPELKQELVQLGHSFRGMSDTEVLLAGVEQWGLEAALGRFVGMFAFALWDKRERVLSLARDRMGEKPLFYGWQGPNFVFGSELKAMRAYPGWTAALDLDALALYFRLLYIPAPHSIYRGVYKLPPGMLLQVQRRGETLRLLGPTPYWSLEEVVERGMATPFSGDEHDAREELHRILLDAVGRQMVADVPLGCFLSGGVDSSTVAALMQAKSASPVRTFTIGFSDKAYNEAEQAKAVATYFGATHTELYASPEDALAVIPSLPSIWDEPFADSSQIPTYLVSKLTRNHVVVSLSGDGGDEVFGGYNRYIWGPSIWNTMTRLPVALRRCAGAFLQACPVDVWEAAFMAARAVLPARMALAAPGEKLPKLVEACNATDAHDLFFRVLSQWNSPADILIGGKESWTCYDARDRWPQGMSFLQHMQYLDMQAYLPGDILTKVDRASMAVGLESRAPFLDHRVVEFAWRLPDSMKTQGGIGKRLLREVLHGYAPPQLVDKPKMGFSIPLRQWLRGPLRDWAESLLSAQRLKQSGLLRPAPIRRCWERFLATRSAAYLPLWAVLQFQAWLDLERGESYS